MLIRLPVALALQINTSEIGSEEFNRIHDKDFLIQFFICTSSEADCCPVDLEPDREITPFKTAFFRCRSLFTIAKRQEERTKDFDYDSVKQPPIVFDEEPILSFKEGPPQMPPVDIILDLLPASSDHIHRLLTPFEDAGEFEGFNSAGQYAIQLGGWISSSAAIQHGHGPIHLPGVAICDYCVEDAETLLPEDVEVTPIKRSQMQPFLYVDLEFLDMWQAERTENYVELYVVLWQCHPVHINNFRSRHLLSRG
ncbi:hypothetical protein HDV00_008092 [Rhizophlyctis rosea]|nr:hypothetical protein HDV00_008092 [Rhizophlyctis rosea]